MKVGERIELLSMPNDPDPIPVGSQGTITHVEKLDDSYQIDVDWDSGRTLMLITPPDRFRTL